MAFSKYTLKHYYNILAFFDETNRNLIKSDLFKFRPPFKQSLFLLLFFFSLSLPNYLPSFFFPSLPLSFSFSLSSLYLFYPFISFVSVICSIYDYHHFNIDIST